MLTLCAIGCGTTKTQQVTDQMLMSSAVDRTISEIDFRVLADREVYLDIKHIRAVKGIGFVNADYIVSSLRQQMFASRVRLVEKVEDAQVIVEARVGALGTDGHDITYGVPASNTISTAASLVPNAPNIPTVPELSLARRTVQMGGAKLALFAYERTTKDPVWQSGVKTAMSDARNFWILGAGPFQRGTIYDGTQFAGSRLDIGFLAEDGQRSGSTADRVAYDREHLFGPKPLPENASEVQTASFEQPAQPNTQAGAQATTPPATTPPATTPPTTPPATTTAPASAAPVNQALGNPPPPSGSNTPSASVSDGASGNPAPQVGPVPPPKPPTTLSPEKGKASQ